MGDLVFSVVGLFLETTSLLVEVVRRVRVTVHLGYFPGSNQQHAFVNVANLSGNRDVEVGAVWFETPERVPVLNGDRPLAELLKPGASWETWIPLDQLGGLAGNRLYRSARVRLAGGRVVKSRRNKSTPPAGTPPGWARHES